MAPANTATSATTEEPGHVAPATDYRAELAWQCGRLLVPAALICLFAWLPYLRHDTVLHPESAALPWLRYGLSGVALAVLGIYLGTGKKHGLILAFVLVGYLEVAAGVVTGLTGGQPSYVGGYVMLLMLIPATPLPRRWQWAMLAASLIAFLAAGSTVGMDLSKPEKAYSFNDLGSAVVVSAILVWMLDAVRNGSWRKSMQIEEQRNQIAADKQRIDELLLNMLPAPVASELKQDGDVRPRFYESVSVGFTDFQGFTTYAEQVSPRRLVQDLDRTFSRFDDVMDDLSLEKLKTIGDAYMFAGGIPVTNGTHAVDVVLAGLRLVRIIEELRAETAEEGVELWNVRVGVNTGPVIAGIVGHKKFVYDIWGDTVNVAARLESSCKAGHLNISEATHRAVQSFFVTEFRGELPAKNKGMVPMYFVHRIRADLSVDGDGITPNDVFEAKRKRLIQGARETGLPRRETF